MKRILAVIMLLCLLLTGCGQSKTKKPIYELPDISWGDSIEQAEKVFGELTEVTDIRREMEAFSIREYTAAGEYAGYAVSYRFWFYEYGGCRYLTHAWIAADTDFLSEKEQLQFCYLLEEQFADIDVIHLLGEHNPDYGVPTTDDLTDRQKDKLEQNCALLALPVFSNRPLLDISLEALSVGIDASYWVLANVEFTV